MAKKRILTIGFELCDEHSEYSHFDNNISLLDWDIILIKPDINEYIHRQNSYFKGSTCLSDHDSFKLKSQSEHWRREIKSAIQHGKLVIIFLCELKKYTLQLETRPHQEQAEIRKSQELSMNMITTNAFHYPLTQLAVKEKK